MLSKIVKPKTKAELIKALQGASFRSFDILEGQGLSGLASKAELARSGASVIVLRHR